MDSTRDQGLVLMAMKLDRRGLIKVHNNILTQKLFKLLTVHRENYFIQIYIADLDKYYRGYMATTLGNTFCTHYFFNFSTFAKPNDQVKIPLESGRRYRNNSMLGR